MELSNSKKGLFVFGLVAGLVAVVLAMSGNPKNMAICVACFIRDMAGSMKFHTAAVVQYFRPEIVGFVLWICVVLWLRTERKIKRSL